MGTYFPGHERQEPSICPPIIQDVTTPEDIQKCFSYMEKEFHLSKKWRKEYDLQLKNYSRQLTVAEVFCRFGRDHLEEAFKIIIQRDFPVIKILNYIVKDKVEAKQKKESDQRRYYRSGAWERDIKKGK